MRRSTENGGNAVVNSQVGRSRCRTTISDVANGYGIVTTSRGAEATARFTITPGVVDGLSKTSYQRRGNRTRSIGTGKWSVVGSGDLWAAGVYNGVTRSGCSTTV